jgi:hypothetical protein
MALLDKIEIIPNVELSKAVRFDKDKDEQTVHGVFIPQRKDATYFSSRELERCIVPGEQS